MPAMLRRRELAPRIERERAVYRRLSMLEDNALVAAYLAGADRALTVLYERYRPRLARFITLQIRDSAKAEDITQEAFIRAHSHLKSFDRTKKFSTWIYTITVNLIRNEIRNRKRSPLVLFQQLEENLRDSSLEFPDLRFSAERLYEKRHLHELVRAATLRLSERWRLLFTLREFEGKSYAEISEITGINPGSVKSGLNRARAAFAANIAPWLD